MLPHLKPIHRTPEPMPQKLQHPCPTTPPKQTKIEFEELSSNKLLGNFKSVADPFGLFIPTVLPPQQCVGPLVLVRPKPEPKQLRPELRRTATVRDQCGRSRATSLPFALF